MSILDELRNVAANNNLNRDYTYIDSDTVASKRRVDSDGKPLKYRIKGIQAPETTKFFNNGLIKPGTAGTNDANAALQALAKKMGFTNLVPTGKFDPRGREEAELVNDKGVTWQTALARNNILEPNQYTSNEANRAYRLASIFGTQSNDENWDKARNIISDAIVRETKYEQAFKRKAVDELELAYGGNYFAPGSVMWRDHSRDLNNKAMSPFSTAIDVGLTGAVEAMFGFAEMSGETSGWNWLENVGEAGVYRARDKLKNMPEIVTSFRDINGFFGKEGALQYVANNGAISLPYMVATIAGALAWPVAGISVIGAAATGLALSPVALYTGTVWNDMEGDNKDPVIALGAGLSQAVLDRFGLKFLMGGKGLVTKEGREEVTTALMNKSRTAEGQADLAARGFAGITDITRDQAEKMVLLASRKELATFATDAAKFAKKQLNARNLSKYLLKRTSIGAAGEGITEALQETVGYTAAHVKTGFRDWDANEFNTRLIDASIAGSSLGGALSTAGTMFETAAWTDIAHRTGVDTGKHTSNMGQKARQDTARYGKQFHLQEHNESIPSSIADYNARRQTIETEINSIETTLNNPNFMILNADGTVDPARVAQLEQKRSDLQAELQALQEPEEMNDRVDREDSRRSTRDLAQLGREGWRAIPALWRGWTRYLFDNMGGIQEDSLTARIMAEKTGANLQRSTSGQSYENRKNTLISEIRYKFGDVTSWLARFGFTDHAKSRKEFSELFYSAFNQAKRRAEADGGRLINWTTDLDRSHPLYEKRWQLALLHSKLREAGDNIHEAQQKHNPELGYIDDYMSRHKSFDKEAIENDRQGFESALLSLLDDNGQPLMTPAVATKVTDAILRQDGINELPDSFDADGDFSVTAKSTFRPQSHRRRNLNLSDRPEFSKFMEGDLFTNFSNSAKSAVRYVALEEYVGSDNTKINYELQKIENELIESGNWTAEQAKARVDRLAKGMKTYYDAESGNYNRIQSPMFLWAQKNLLFVTTLTGLPLATISNFVELALLNKSLTWNQMFGKDKGSINHIAKSFADEINNTANRFYGQITNQPTPHRRSEGGHAIIKRLGFLDWEVGAAHTTGVTETGRWHQRWLDIYFKVILLQQWTNAARASRAAIAGDYISDKIATLVTAKQTGVITNEAAEAAEALRNLGMDPNFAVQYSMGFPDRAQANDMVTATRSSPTFEEEAKMKAFLDDATFNFVNEAVALPQSANRPLIFQDPRFALFTQFQGFIATFTANHIPKMWGEMARRGTPAMKYNVFATMVSMIALGFASQHLKDLLKYGKTTPYFEGMEYVRRGVGASGLLGTSERAIDFAFPMYDKRYDNVVTWTLGGVAGESAALSKALRAGGLGYDVAFEDKDLSTLAKISPMTQVIQQQTKKLPTWELTG